MLKKEKTQHQIFITKSVYVYTTKRDTLGDNIREGNGTPLQYSCWENPTNRGVGQAAVHGAAKELDTTEHSTVLPAFEFRIFQYSNNTIGLLVAPFV